MIKRRNILIAAIALTANQSCSAENSYNSKKCKELTHEMISKNPKKDARRASAIHNEQFIAVSGIGIELPGLDNHPDLIRSILENHRYKLIEGTSDEQSGEECVEYQLSAKRYAEVFNREMLAIMAM